MAEAQPLAMQGGKSFSVKMTKRQFIGKSRQLMDKIQKNGKRIRKNNQAVNQRVKNQEQILPLNTQSGEYN